MELELNKKTTAEQVANHYADRAKGKLFLITGGYGGLGAEDALRLLAVGAKVHVGGRSKKSLDEFLVRNTNPNLTGDIIDLADLNSVKSFAERFKEKHESLDVLINNAGVMNSPQGATEQGLEMQFGVNVVGPHLLTQLLVPLLAKGSQGGRIVMLSSLAHRIHGAHRLNLAYLRNYDVETSSYDGWVQYQQSKLADLLLAKAYVSLGLSAASVHPGVINTGLARDTSIWSTIKFAVSNLWEMEVFKSVESGAATTMLVALTPHLEEGAYYADCQVLAPHDNATHPEDVQTLLLYLEDLIKDYRDDPSSKL